MIKFDDNIKEEIIDDISPQSEVSSNTVIIPYQFTLFPPTVSSPMMPSSKMKICNDSCCNPDYRSVVVPNPTTTELKSVKTCVISHASLFKTEICQNWYTQPPHIN